MLIQPSFPHSKIKNIRRTLVDVLVLIVTLNTPKLPEAPYKEIPLKPRVQFSVRLLQPLRPGIDSARVHLDSGKYI